MQKVSIDRTGCISCGNCWNVCPKVFEQKKEDGKSQITKKFRVKDDISKGEVTEKMESLSEAEKSCPVNVIQVKG
jgi:ferredoxin